LGFTFHLPAATLTTTDNHAKNHSLTFVVVGLAGVKFLDFYIKLLYILRMHDASTR
jgi:hypothetical protein